MSLSQHSLAWALNGFILLTLISGCSDRSLSEAELPKALDEYIAPFVANGDFSGVIAVAQGGRLIASSVGGYANFETQQKATLNDPFPIASITKTVTAAAIHQLEEEGALRLTDPLSRFLPSFPDGSKITIEHLLAHQSGVPDYWTLEGARAAASCPISLTNLVDWLASQPLQFEPGTGTAYSNSGYALLAAVIDAATGIGFDNYVTESVLAKAGMEHTAPIGSQQAAVLGYHPAAGHLKTRRATLQSASFLIGAGSLQASASDLLRWCRHFNDEYDASNSRPFLYGWGAREDGSRRWAEQSGRVDGFASHVRAYPDERLCVVVLSNIESQAVNAIGAAVGDMANGQKRSPPKPRNSFEVSHSLESYAGAFGSPTSQWVEVNVIDGALHLRGVNGLFLPLEPIEPDRFFYRQLYVEIHVERGPRNEVTALLWGGSYRMPRFARQLTNHANGNSMKTNCP